MISFFLPMKKPPTVTAQEHKIAVINGKPVVYSPPELSATRNKLKCMLVQYKPKKPLDGSLRLVTKWCYPISGKHFDGEYKNTKPDTDNLVKMLKDVMEELGFYVNDSRVASETIEKFWADVPGIWIFLEEIKQ